MNGRIPNIPDLMAQIECLMPAPEPDRMFMCEVKADELVAAIEKRADANGCRIAKNSLLGGPMTYAGIKIIPLPTGTKIRNRRTGEEAVINAVDVLACTFEWEVVR